MVFMREVRENKETLLRPEFAYVDLMARWRIYLGGMRSYSVHLYIVTVATMQDKENDWYAI